MQARAVSRCSAKQHLRSILISSFTFGPKSQPERILELLILANVTTSSRSKLAQVTTRSFVRLRQLQRFRFQSNLTPPAPPKTATWHSTPASASARLGSVDRQLIRSLTDTFRNVTRQANGISRLYIMRHYD